MQVSMSRFAQGLPDTVGQDAQHVTQCEVCGAEIFPGDWFYSTDYGDCCEETECLVKLVGAELKEAL